jgi:hypothetical protein
MPYIPAELREGLDPYIDVLVEELGYLSDDKNLAGLLNYTISKILSDLLKSKGLNYHNINELIGMLECAKLELYRRVASPYEDEKIKSNGDVY